MRKLKYAVFAIVLFGCTSKPDGYIDLQKLEKVRQAKIEQACPKIDEKDPRSICRGLGRCENYTPVGNSTDQFRKCHAPR